MRSYFPAATFFIANTVVLILMFPLLRMAAPLRTEAQTSHRDRRILDALIFEPHRIAVIRRAESIKEGIPVIRRGDAEPARLRLLRVLNDGVVIPVFEALLHPGIELDCPVEGPRVVGEIDPPTGYERCCRFRR